MKRTIRQIARLGISFAKSIGKPKVFCVGHNKTGTTSVAKALKDLGIIVAKQRPAENMIHDWARRDFRKIIRFCYTAQAFQDIPFSLPYTFQALDMQFPGSKFILTVRDSPEQWHQSLTRFHAKLFGHNKIPTIHDLKKASYCYRGWIYEVHCALYNKMPDNEPYNKEILIKYYQNHNQSVIEYFRHRPDDLLILNVAQEGAYRQFCEFLEKPCLRKSFPWKNKTEEIDVQ